jgi:putative ABC transport system ATP-binding protein
MGVFQKLNEEQNMTVILVTHEPDIADFAKRIILFRDGRIRKDYRVENRRSAEQALLDLPVEEDEEEDDG